jgi:uncharacterized Zn finger protein
MNGAEPTGLAILTAARLRDEAGERAYVRGTAYFESGAVTDLVVSDETINARVMGGDEYAVQLWNENGVLGYSCTCPVGEDGEFCKHGVAAGLAWLAGQGATRRAGARKDDLAAIREWLASAPRERLTELLLEQALNDPALRSRLDAQAARAGAKRDIDIKSLKETVGKALAVSGFADGNEARAARQGRRGGGFVDYHGMRRLIQRAWPVVELIAGLLDDGHADTARDLAHYALKRGIAAYERTDDSGGGFGDLLRRIAELHLEACRAAPPEPTAFGKQFFELQMRDDWGLVAFEDYAPLLGEAGLRVYRALAEKEWKQVPARGPAESESRASTSYYRITSIMESLAREANDTDALVAIKRRDLTLPYHFLEIANVLAAAGRRDEALDWAERGRKTFPDRPDSRLTDFLADEYGQRGRHEEAIVLAWEQFRQQPALASYQRLKTSTERAGVWGEWRAKVLAWLREDFQMAQKHDRRRWSWMPGGHSLLVEIFLREGDNDAALAEAKSGGCTESLWFELAQAREKDHPADAAEIYRNRLDGIVEQKHNHAYDEAAALVAKIRKLMQRTNQEKEFAAWLDAVRTRHKAKRNFMQRLDERLG